VLDETFVICGPSLSFLMTQQEFIQPLVTLASNRFSYCLTTRLSFAVLERLPSPPSFAEFEPFMLHPYVAGLDT